MPFKLLESSAFSPDKILFQLHGCEELGWVEWLDHGDSSPVTAAAWRGVALGGERLVLPLLKCLNSKLSENQVF